MNGNFHLHLAEQDPGQERGPSTRSGCIREWYGPNPISGEPRYDMDSAVKFERRGSSASLGPQEMIADHSLGPWKPPSPGTSDVGGDRRGSSTTSASPFPSDHSVVPQLDAENHSQGLARRAAGPAQPTRSAARFHHHPQVWESHKAEIEEIYMKQNKSLKELIAIMKEKGFKATPRMYKSKFELWGFVKNNRSKDVAVMLRLQRQRDAAGKPTTFQRHGKMVDIHNYMKRKRISSRDLTEPNVEADLPEYLRCLTPPPAEPQHMALPDHLHTQDILVSCFRDLTLGWRDSARSPMSFEEDFNAYFDGELCEATRDFSRACWFFSRGYTSHGALLSQHAFSTLDLLVTKPSALGLFDLLIASVITPDYGLVKELWKYLAAYAKAKLGGMSTFYRLFRALEETFQNNALEAGVDFVFNCMESIIGMLLEHKDLAHTIAPAISFFLLGDLILFNSTRTDLPSLQRAIAASQDLIVADGTDNAPAVIRFLEPAAYLWQYGPEDELSFQLANAALHQQDPVSDRFDWTYWVAWRVVAEFHRSRCPDDSAGSNPRHSLARYSLERAVDAAEAGRGFGEVQIYENLQKLEDWHHEAGDAAQELAVRRRKEGMLRAYLEILQKPLGVGQPRTPSSQ
ncbi:hypothetical protein DL770_006637 [Monosporascus sp. CRB-9-2]|nr:hypothetical protein DL770_006637 [Monosporascus sp. CRB-9-2]